MPVVTIDPNARERFELRTAPAADENDEAGWVELRALPYGMKLTRRDKATKMMMQTQSTQSKKSEVKSEIELLSQTEWAVQFDFANCIIDHNLTDSGGRKLDFSRPMDLKLLNPKVGSEIEKHINSLNEDEDELQVEDFLKPSSTLSTDAENELPDNGLNPPEIAKEM